MSIQRAFKEPTCDRRQFTVQTYYGIEEYQYFFTVEGNTLYRIESDLVNLDWVVARDMGSQRVITEIDPEIIEVWQNNNGWQNIRVIRPGIARKFQVLSMVRGNISVSDNPGVAWNSGAYLEDRNTPIYNYETNTVNDMLIVGRDTTTNPSAYTQTLPYGTFWALNDPIVIEYDFSDSTYRRAIKNRIDETTHF